VAANAKQIFTQIKHVAIETNNRCNYAHMHKKCPAHSVKQTIVLPQKYVFEIIDTLGNNEYSNALSFFHYNDSLIEPRLFTFIQYAKNKCPNTNIVIGTNGLMLTKPMALELYDAGVSCILISTYSKVENEHFNEMKAALSKIPVLQKKSFSIRHKESLDDRLLIQDGEHGVPLEKRTCNAPLSEVIIRSNGEMPLCCADVNCSASFGNVKKEKFITIIKKHYTKIKSLKEELREGIKKLEICKNCFYNRRWRSDNMRVLFKRGKLSG